MKKILPILLTLIFFVVSYVSPLHVSAQTLNTVGSTDSRWVIDPEVTFIGKNAARAGLFLDWTLLNYNWVCVSKVTARQCDDSNNPIAKYWSLIVLYIVVPLLFVVILATSAVIIITRGKSLTIMKFIPRFIAVVLLIVFSYSLLQFFYQFTDLIQGFFLRTNISNPCPPDCISQKDLLYVGWDYTKFVGLRLIGDPYAESAFISLLLTKITALTYFVMVFILLVRKIILWFFIIVSPIFPILLLYYPVRNTAKIWIGEFFRWLLYAPLFAIFLNGLVYLWKNQIPLVFVNSNIGVAGKEVFPTAVNILLGGPKQFVTPNNSVNLIETFALYVVSLIMLWIVILLPWILLQIFLDYASNFAPNDTAVMKTLVNMATNNRPSIPPGGAQPPPEGAAIAVPFAKKFAIPKDLQPGPAGMAKELNIGTANIKASFATPANMNSATFTNANINTNMNNAQVNAQVVAIANVKVPTMRDIAKYDTALISRDTSRQTEMSQITKQLEKIANPVTVTNTVERDQIREIREQITERSEKGNNVATSILQAASTVSRERVEASNSELKSVLQQIANPASTSSTSSSTSVVNREKLAKLNETLQKESKQNNNQLASSLLSISEKTSAVEIDKIKDQLKVAAARGDKVATSVISTVNTASRQTQSATQLKNVLQQISNPASVTNAVEREKFTKLHDALEKESKEKNNSLASSILQVNDSTSVSSLEKIREQLSQSKENTVMQSVNTVVSQSQSSAQIKSVLQEIANPESTKTNVVNKEKVNKLRESLSKASKEGNELATSILSVSEKTSVQDIEKLSQKLQDAKAKGEPLATELTALTQQNANLPATNRVQTVSKEDYQAVKDMWKQNYQNLEVPKGMAASRGEWIKDDIAQIDETIGLLSSTDETKVKEGMDQVSNILPFLMMGGFSQTEIIDYLKAKQEAAKDVSKSMTIEEEDQISVKATTSHAEKTMSATMEEANTSSSSSVSSSASSSEDDSPLTNITNTDASVTYTQPEIKNEILNMVNLKVPKLQDIARYDMTSFKKDGAHSAEVSNVQNVLTKIANPGKITDATERAQFEKVRDKLLTEKQNGNASASSLLNASMKAQGKSDEQMKTVLSQIANPSLATVEADKKRFTQLHDELSKASEGGNELARSILATHTATSIEEISQLSEKLKDAKGEPIVASVLKETTATDTLPQSNQMQTVSKEDYLAVKDMWKKNYQNLEVPQGIAGSRADWIKADISSIDETVGLLTSPDQEKVKEGMDHVSNILPFLMMGGFSQTEIVEYLKAKQEAAKEVTVEMAAEEESKVSVNATTKHAENSMAAAASEAGNGTIPAGGSQSSDDTAESPLVTMQPQAQSSAPAINLDVLNVVNLKMPKLQDIARTETSILKNDSDAKAEVQNVQTVLRNIANPASITDAAERTKFESARESMLTENEKGNPAARMILRASMQLQGNKEEQVKTALSHIANPSLTTVEADKKRYEKLHDELSKASENGNELAKTVLATHEGTTVDDVKKLSEKLKEEKAKGEPLAASILGALLDDAETDKANQVQQVSAQDYAEVKKLWEENYKTLPVPATFGTETTGRIAWITADVKTIEETIELLKALDTQKQKEGMQKVSEILPMLLLGGFTNEEIVGYLQAKVAAGKEVMQGLQKDEESKVTVSAGQSNEKTNEQEQSAQTEEKKDGV